MSGTFFESSGKSSGLAFMPSRTVSAVTPTKVSARLMDWELKKKARSIWTHSAIHEPEEDVQNQRGGYDRETDSSDRENDKSQP